MTADDELASVILPTRWFLTDARVGRLSHSAFRLALASLAMSVHNQTEGHITDEILGLLPRLWAFTQEHRSELVESGLWEPVADGYRFVEFESTQTTKSHRMQVDLLRQRHRDRYTRRRDKVDERVMERDGFRCVRCGSTDDLTIDHIIPRARGGSLDEDNLQTLCRSCNARKGTKLGDTAWQPAPSSAPAGLFDLPT